MIYEKRDADFRIKREDLPVKNLTITPITEEGNEQHEMFSRQTDNIPIKKVHRGRSVPHARARKTRLVVAALVLFCLFTIDARIFGGKIRSEISTCAKKSAIYTLENIAEKSESDKSTLYIRLLSDSRDDVSNTDSSSVAHKFESFEKTPEMSAQTVTVANSTSLSFVDGEMFYPITTLDLSADSLYSLTNATSFSPNLEKLTETSPKALSDIEITDDPLVLIVHTHGEESYTDYIGMYPENEGTRNRDTEKNVVRVGKEIKDTLSDFGINAVQCTKMHDSESFINAYSGSASSVKQYLKEYPSIKVVIDVHRDAIIRDDGESIKAAVEIAGKEYAQLMFVVGTNELGHNHPDWQDNLSLALALQKSIDSTYPSLCRSINLRDVPFNQQLSSGYLLLEVGTCANTLDEALRSARAFGENLARIFISAQ